MRARPARRARGARALVAALLVAACGPYPDVAQKLDVTTPIAGGDTFVAAQGTEVRVLVLGKLPPGGGASEFAFSALQMPTSAGTSATALQGQWTEDAAGATATFTARRAYLLPDESGESVLSRTGVTREDVNRTYRLAVTRTPGRLVLEGDATLAGTYVVFREALARLGTATERDAACAFQVANLGLRSSELRILGFGGPSMTQYKTAATFVGTLEGVLRVRLSQSGVPPDTTTTITFYGFSDMSGTRADGPQITEVNIGGDGHMSGTVRFLLEPLAADGTAGAPVAGTMDFGDADPPDAVQIRNGNPVGGHYLVALDGGGTARVSPATAPAPSVAECLVLP